MSQLTRYFSSNRSLLIIIILALLAGGAGIFTMPVLDRDEARYAQATTQMLQNEDYIQIRFQDQARNKKPVGIYWLQAASVKLFSSVQARQIWAYRLPSLLLATLAAIATYWAGIYLVGRKAAFAGAALFAVSVLLAVEAGIAKTDAALVATTTIMLVTLSALRSKNNRWAVLLFWMILGASILIKGPIGPTLIALSLLFLTIWERKVSWLRPLMVWWGPVLVMVMVLPWLWAIQQATDGEFLREALGGDFAAKLAGAQESHGAPPGMYMALLAFTIFPASFFLLPGIIKAWRIRHISQNGSDIRLLIAWIIPFFLLLEITPTKLVHYPLPVYPALALICGLGWQFLTDFRWIRGLSAGLGLLMPILLLAGIIYLQQVAEPEPWNMPPLALTILSLLVVAALGASIFIIRGQSRQALILALSAGLFWQFAVRSFIVPSHPMTQTTERISNQLAELGLHPLLSKNANSEVLSINYREPSLVFKLGTNTILAADNNALQAWQRSKAKTIVYSALNCDPKTKKSTIPTSLDQFLDTLGGQQRQCAVQQAEPFYAYNYSKGQCLTVYIFTLQTCK